MIRTRAKSCIRHKGRRCIKRRPARGLRNAPQLLSSAIEEVLRYRSPFQWIMRTPIRDVDVHGTAIPKGAFVLPMVGAANRDPKHFPHPNGLTSPATPTLTSHLATASISVSAQR
jgi:cytochrome P450